MKILAFILMMVGVISGILTAIFIPISIHLGFEHINRVHENEISNKFFSIVYAIIGIFCLFICYFLCTKGYKIWQKN
jgi:drug/metabolite transporter (DMT)-like permease